MQVQVCISWRIHRRMEARVVVKRYLRYLHSFLMVRRMDFHDRFHW